MDLNAFAKRISKLEGKKKQVDIAQIKEILKIINRITNGILYSLVKTIE